MCSNNVNESEHRIRLSDVVGEPHRMLPPIKGFEEYPIVSLEKSVELLKHLIPELDQMLYVVQENCRHPRDDLTSDESGSIMIYSMEWTRREQSFYYLLNENLRSENRQLLKPWFFYLRLFVHSLSKLNSFSQTIYRGIKLDLTEQYPRGRKFVWWAFSSCTDSIEVLENEAFFGRSGKRTLFLIECHTGKDIRNHSIFPTENEILLTAARQFEVISVLNAGNDLHLIQIKEIQPPFPLISHSPSILQTLPLLSPHQQQIQQIINKSPNSSQINFENENIRDEDLEYLLDETIGKKITSKLLLGSNEITSKGSLILSNILFWNENLQELILYNNHLGDNGVRHLSNALSNRNCSLKILSLGSNSITDLGMKYLSNMIEFNQSLTELGLVFNQITDRGIERFSQSISSSNSVLQILYLSKNSSITDRSIQSFIRMIQSKDSFKQLWLQNCRFSDQGKDKFRQLIRTRTDFRLEF